MESGLILSKTTGLPRSVWSILTGRDSPGSQVEVFCITDYLIRGVSRVFLLWEQGESQWASRRGTCCRHSPLHSASCAAALPYPRSPTSASSPVLACSHLSFPLTLLRLPPVPLSCHSPVCLASPLCHSPAPASLSSSHSSSCPASPLCRRSAITVPQCVAWAGQKTPPPPCHPPLLLLTHLPCLPTTAASCLPGCRGGQRGCSWKEGEKG